MQLLTESLGYVFLGFMVGTAIGYRFTRRKLESMTDIQLNLFLGMIEDVKKSRL